ncbi:hypothetical protein DYBT9275_02781 [Dyadobacter sp. CECT 9275]|uniref:Uncharacterized protein n=1 Tax=Dyadobacter helix TaxID=2822344 RepID=A0A916NLN6_9BACT|nr:hypothetical protein [Dyadobacter sp. CECT 9275]CAG5001989.1 hypothetical protein DYBT9275_02781 [Dyadobacter sp. CECT 9275]
MATEIILPKIFRELSYSSIAEQDTSIVISNMSDKIFAVDKYDIASSEARALQLYSHLHWGTTGVTNDKLWDTVRWYGESVTDKVNSIVNHKDFLFWAEMRENGFSPSNVEAVYSQRFDNLGVADPTDTNQMQDYWAPGGVGIDLLTYTNSPTSGDWSNLITRYSSETEARKEKNGSVTDFINSGAHEYRNWLAMGYLDAFHRVPEHAYVYGAIIQLELMHLAIRRKAVMFCEPILEGAAWFNYRAGSMQSVRFANPAGTIYKSVLNTVPAEISYRQGIISHEWGEGMTHWGPSSRDTKDIARWVRSHNGGLTTWKTKWKADNSSNIVDYDFNNPTQPARSPGDNPNNYPDPQIIPPSFGGPVISTIHKSLAGRYMASITKSKRNKLFWPSFEWTTKGGTVHHDGYFDGTDPVLGSLGDGSITTLNNRNFGQHNAANQLRYKKPICVWGANGSDKIAHYCNPVAGINEEQEVTIDVSGGPYTFTAVGPNWQVFNL